ncbi:MAG: O-antigen ligase family protein, partial [Acidobacteriaceae bacterium]|nr:O-antigen ligase family protein [Acidobacteriaceae bacterium]
GAGAIFFGKTRLFGVIWFSFAVIFALTPAILFARGSTLAIATGFVLFLALTRRWLLVSTIVLIGITVFVAADRVIGDVVHRATDVNVETGQGFSGRYSRWDKAIEAIRSQPITGYGFGQEWPVLSSIGSEGRAHNAYLSVWLEMGLGGLTLLCAVVAAYLRTAYLLIRRPETRDLGALMLALVVAICMDSFGLPTLYWEKLPTIALALSLALTGIGERLQWRPVVRRDSNLTAQVGHASYGAA